MTRVVAAVAVIHNTLATVPSLIDGVSGPQEAAGPSIYSAKDGSLWRIDFNPNATAAQKQAAISQLANITPAPLTIYEAQVWQLQAVMSASTWTGPTWAQVTTAVQNSGNVTLIAFFTHPGNVIPSNSTTLAALGQQLGMAPAQIVALVQQASTITLP